MQVLELTAEVRRREMRTGSDVAAPTVTPVLVAELLAEGERMPVFVHVVDHPDARVLVDTGSSALGSGQPSPRPWVTPAVKASPAQLVSTTSSTGRPVMRSTSPCDHAVAPRAPWVQITSRLRAKFAHTDARSQ